MRMRHIYYLDWLTKGDRMKCKRCGFVHNGSKEAINYHKTRCVDDRIKDLNDPFKLNYFKDR